MLQTRFCERFGVAAPIVVAPMGPDLTGPELVAAVSNAGGFGILQAQLCPPPLLTAPIHESCLRLAFLLKARRSAGRWWSSDKADWKSVVVTWSGRRLYPLHCMNRLLLKRNIIPRTNIALSLRTRQRSSLWEISKR